MDLSLRPGVGAAGFAAAVWFAGAAGAPSPAAGRSAKKAAAATATAAITPSITGKREARRGKCRAGSRDPAGLFSPRGGGGVGRPRPTSDVAAIFGVSSRRFTCATNCGVGSAPGRRVHCTRMNSGGTTAPASRVSSMTTGARNGTPSAIRCVCSTASFHSSRK